MLTLLLTFLGSSGFGSILGGVMGWLNRRVDLDAKRIDLEHEKDRWGHELELRRADLEQVKAEAAGRREVAVVEGDASVEAARMAALAASFQADRLDGAEIQQAGRLGWLLVLSDALRRLIRPVATVLLLGSTLYINWLIIGRWTNGDWASITPAERYTLMLQTLSWGSAQASSVLSYWFVSRGSSK